jgi:replication factor A1
VPLKWIKKHRASLIEDRVYRLRYVDIIDARNSHCPVPHPFMAHLTGHTKIVEVTEVPQSFPLYACSIASFATLRTRLVCTYDMSGTLHSAFFFAHVCSRDLELGMTQFSNNRLHWHFL